MAQVVVRDSESLESALKRFKRSCARDGVMAELRKHMLRKQTQEEVRGCKKEGKKVLVLPT